MNIAVTNQKGGTGKTTTACNMTIMFAGQGKKALLVDADPQKSAMDFRSIRADREDYSELVPFSTIENSSKTLHQDIKGFTDAFDYIIMDSGGRDNPAFRSSLLCADITVVPIIPSSTDFWGSQKTFDIIAEAQSINENMKVYALFNIVKAGTIIEREIVDLVQQFESEYDVKFLNNKIYDRMSYKYSMGQGISIFEMSAKQRDQKAIEEFTAVCNELFGV